MQELADVALWGSQANQHVQVLSELYEQYYDRVVRYIAARTRNRDIAEDLAGEAFVRMTESIDSSLKRGVPPHASLFRIAHNLLVDHYRRNARRRTAPIEDAYDLASDADPQAEVEQRISLEQVHRLMDRLNPGQREVIALRLVGGLSAEEAGAVMGRTSGAVRELQRTALKALRAMLAKESMATPSRGQEQV